MNENKPLSDIDRDAFLTDSQARVLGCLMEKKLYVSL